MGLCQSCVSACTTTAAPTKPPRKISSPSLSASRSTSLTEMALQNSSGGKRIVCQLTMVGVVENGNGGKQQVIPVPPQPDAGRSYFILEPPKAAASSSSNEALDDDALEDIHQMPGQAKFRIRNGVHSGNGDCEKEGDAAKAGAVSGASGKSEYFLLQPLEQEGDLSELAEALSTQSSLDGEREEWRLGKDLDGNLNGGGLCGRRAVSHSRELIKQAAVSEEGEERHPFHRQSFRNSRLRSCPDAGESPDDTSPTLPPRNGLLGYKRSLSSPISSFNLHHRHHNHYQRPDGEDDDEDYEDKDYPVWERKERKMDAVALNERIQRELRKLGIVSDASQPPATADGEADDDDDVLGSDAGSDTNNADDDDDIVDRPDHSRPRKNEYFILEPEADMSDDSVDDGGDDGINVGVGVFRLRQGQNTSPTSATMLPPPLTTRDIPSNRPISSRSGTASGPPLPAATEGGVMGTATTTTDPNERPRYQRQYTTPALPPRNPQRNFRFAGGGRGHSRSKSETPVFKPGSTGALCSRRKEEEREVRKESDAEQGPVVISLKSVKKSKSREGLTADCPEDESFRPRLKSESGILSKRSRKA